MDDFFDKVFDRVIGIEAGYVNDPDDPGGETKYGISKRAYPDLDIANLTRDQAKAIYGTDYWMRTKDIKSDAVHYQLFDAAVNHGYDNAIRFLQRAIRAADDGHWGPASQAAYDAMPENDVLLRFLAYRLKFMTDIQKFDKYGRGWSRRISTNLLYAADDNQE